MLDYLFCCLDMLLAFLQKPENRWRVFVSLPVLFLIGMVMPSLLYFLLSQVLFLFLLTYLRPVWLIDFMNWTSLRKNNFTVKYQTVGDFTFCFAERGKPSTDKPSMLFLHGLSATKEMWFPMVTAIPSDRHVILLDMPGHGRSTRRLDFSYSFLNQASRVAQFVIATGLGTRPFHLVGISMGGGVSVAYAATHPQDIKSLSLLCPAGFHTYDKSEYLRDIAKGFIAADEGKMPLTSLDHRKAFPYFFHVPKGHEPPKLYAWLAFEITNPRRLIHGKVSNDLKTDVNSKVLHRHLPKIEAPTQVLWGKYDRLVHPCGADIVKEALPTSKVHMLDKCGHTISYDRPFKAMKLILEFGER